MKISVKGFRGIESAVIEAAPLALLCGVNHSGKSSVCLAVAAALTGNPMPYLKTDKDGKPVNVFTKSQSGILVRAGLDKGSVSIESDTGRTTITWPDLEYKTDGGAPHASVYATGLISVVDLNDKARSAYLSSLLGTEPSKLDLENTFPGFSSDGIEKIWSSISINGWDLAHKNAKEIGAKIKGSWELTTNDRYGATKAAGWLPQGWDESLASLSVETLESLLAGHRQALETAVAGAAVDGHEIGRLRAIVAAADGVSDHKPDLVVAKKAHADAMTARDALPPAGKPSETIPCPHCEKPLIIVGQTIQAPMTAQLSKAEYAKRSKTLDAAIAKVQSARVKVEAVEQKIALQVLQAKQADDAMAKLAEIEAKPGTSQETLNLAREDVRISEENLRLFTTKTTADRMHASIERNQIIIDALAPDGLRKVKLVKAIEEFNAALKTLCDPAGFKAVSVDEAMDIRYGGRHYTLLSASEQYRVRSILQVAIAIMDGSQVVIFDGADVLDSGGREGLFTLLNVIVPKRIKAAIVAMTFSKPGLVPDLHGAGIGRSYWIQNGRSEEMEDKQ